MPSKYLSPCITYNAGASRLWLPPWVVSPYEFRQTVKAYPVARGTQALITSVAPNLPGEIRLDFPLAFLSTRDAKTVLDFYDSIVTVCSGAKVQLNTWNDVGWGACALEEMTASELEITNRLEVVRNLRMRFISETMRPSTDYAIAFADDTEYEATYPYASNTGRSHGDATSGSPLVVTTVRQSHSGHFAGMISGTTAAGDEHVIRIAGASGSTWTLTNFQATASPTDLATGTTTLRLATAGVGGGGSTIDLNIGSSAKYASPGAGEFTVAVDSDVYVFITAAGGHTNVQYKFDAELAES